MTYAPALSPARPHLPVDPAQVARKREMSKAIYAGEMIPSSALQPHEFYVMVPHIVLRAITRARRLTASQMRYLLCVLEFAPWHTLPGYVVVRRHGEICSPTIDDWSAWLGGMQPQQIYTLRRELHAYNIIHFIAGDPTKVTLNFAWETWDTDVFLPRPARPGAGRPSCAMNKSPIGSKIVGNMNEELNTHVLLPEIAGFVEDKSMDFCAEIDGFVADGSQSIREAVLAPPSKKQQKKQQQKKTPATAGATLRMTTASVHLANPVVESDTFLAPTVPSPAQATRGKASPLVTTAPPHSARPPHPSLPERCAGETNRVYWTRALLRVEPASKAAQRGVIHAAARELLGLALNREDLRLLGQLRHAATSWGTVLHWILTASDATAVDVRAYLYGFIRQTTTPTSKKIWLPEAAGMGPLDVAADEEAREVGGMEGADYGEEPTQEAGAQALGRSLRATQLWKLLDFDILPPPSRKNYLVRLVALREQGTWDQREFLVVLRRVAALLTVAQFTKTDERWRFLFSEMERRAVWHGAASDGQTTSSGEPLLPSPAAPKPVRVAKRAFQLRRVCGASTPFGKALLAYLALEERAALEETAAILVEHDISSEEDAQVLAEAWQQMVRLNTTIPSHDQCDQWFAAVEASARVRCQ